MKQKLSLSRSDGSRLTTIVNVSNALGNSLHLKPQGQIESNQQLQFYYHKFCISSYLSLTSSTPKCLSDQESTQPPVKRTRKSQESEFNFRKHCLCACEIEKDAKNRKRWIPAFLVKEVDKNAVDNDGNPVTSKNKILRMCSKRNDSWAEDVMIHVHGAQSDLHAANARYHKSCLSRFFSGRQVPGQDKVQPRNSETAESKNISGVKRLFLEMKNERSKIWNSAELEQRYVEITGNNVKRANLLKMLTDHSDKLVVLSASGYRNMIMFNDNCHATLKVANDNKNDERITEAVELLVKCIRSEIMSFKMDKNYYPRNISKQIACEAVSPTLLLLLERLSPGIEKDTLPFLLIGSMLTSVIRNFSTPLQIALGILVHSKKIIQHLFDYKVTCSHDEFRRYKKSSAVARYTKLKAEEKNPVAISGLIQHIVDNFDAEMSSPNGKISTHAFAMIECYPETDNTDNVEYFPRIGKVDMSKPVHFDEKEDELVPCDCNAYPLPPRHVLKALPEAAKARTKSITRGSRHDFPSGRPGRTLLFSCCSSPWPRKEVDWNGDVATRVDCVPQRLNSLRNIYPKG